MASDLQERENGAMSDSSRSGGSLRTVLATVALIGMSVVFLFGGLSSTGIWEPWEAHEIFVAQEYAGQADVAPTETQGKIEDHSWSVPTSQGKPVHRPLLKTILLSQFVPTAMVGSEIDVGTVELHARAPIAAVVFLVVLLGFFWLRQFYGVWPAFFSSTVFLTLPAILIGTHNVGSEMLLVSTTTLALMSFVQTITCAPRRRLLWGLVFGLCLALCFLEARLLGVFFVFIVIAAFALTQLAMEETVSRRVPTSQDVSLIDLGGLVAGLVGVIGILAWGYFRTQGTSTDSWFLPHVRQWFAALLPTVCLVSVFWMTRRTRVVRSLVGLSGLLALAVLVAVIVALGINYGSTNPVLLSDGSVQGKIPVLAYFLENHVFTAGLTRSHLTFDIWVRQVGFSMLPWVALLPAGLGYLARSAEVDADSEKVLSSAEMVKRFLLVWGVFAFAVMAVASVYEHYFFPAYFPLAAAIGLMMTDDEFWAKARLRPLMIQAMGFAAVAVVMMLGKDLERFPVRFIEVYLQLEKGFELPEDFSFGVVFKVLKYVSMALLAIYFFGLVSWVVVFCRGLVATPRKLRAWWHERGSKLPSPPTASPAVSGAESKETFRMGPGKVAKIARLFETPRGFGPIILLFFSCFGAVVLFVFLGDLSNHLSQRGVFEVYHGSAESNEKLHRFHVSKRDRSVYLNDIPTVASQRRFSELFEGEERMYAVIPRDRLAAVNYEIRKATGKNLPVLDARSSRLVLVSNRLAEGEEDKSFVNNKIVAGSPEIEYPLEFETKQGKKHPLFDGKLEMLGYSLDRNPGQDGLATYRWGETAVIRYFFKVRKRVTTSQKIFLHVDYPGNRINGDHVPNDGDFPTNYWLPGDTVISEHHLLIEQYASPGTYTMHFGFFKGNNRMKVLPKEAHDGQNRVLLGKIKVVSPL